jgi:competence protein ComEA
MKNRVVFVLAAVLSLTLMGEGVAKETGSARKAEAVKLEQKVAVININQASAEDIAKVLKGIGLKKAEAIVALRTQLGGFKRIEQLLDVKGIGESTLEKNRALIRL